MATIPSANKGCRSSVVSERSSSSLWRYYVSSFNIYTNANRSLVRISLRGYTLALCALICLSFALALSALNHFPLREDEAIYSFWAVHGWRVDPFFLKVWPDKPPLFLGVLALAFQLWGASQASGRFLNILLTLLTALVVGATARRLWGRPHSLIATTLYLLNPFVLSFAPTVYTDPMLVLAGQLALWAALTGAAFGAGFWLAVAIMTKQQGVFYVPLILAVLWTQPVLAMTGQREHQWRRWGRFGVGAVLVLAPIFYWDYSRWAVAPSPWDLGVRNYGALQVLPPAQWLARSSEWASLLWYFTASWPVWSGIALLLLWRCRGLIGPISIRKAPVVWLLLWCGGFFGFHVTTSMQPWDRYLLPLAPLFCLLVAGLLPRVDWSGFQRSAIRWVTLGGLSLLLLLPPALAAARGKLPIGGDHGDYSGLTEAIVWLQREAPPGSILYQQRLGWHYQFYLYDELASGAIDLRWFPTPTYLAANAAQSPAVRRFLVLPDWTPQPNLPLQLAARRIQLVPQVRFGRMTLYALQNQPHAMRSPGCTWCLCKPLSPWPLWPDRTILREAVHP